jgi:hypothetical protein
MTPSRSPVRHLSSANSREAFHKSGTDGSNPVPSSEESANHRFRRRFQGLDVNTERVVACFGQYLNRSHYLEDQRRLGYNLAAGHAKEDRFRH